MPPSINRRLHATVHVNRQAFLDMTLVSLESAVVPPTLVGDSLLRFANWNKRHRNKSISAKHLPPTLIFSSTGLEVAGLIFGETSDERDHVDFIVHRVFPVTAQRSDRSVGHCEASAELLTNWVWALGESWVLIGGFHSHPLLESDVAEIETHQLYGPSFEDLYGRSPFPANNFGLIVAIARTGQRTPSQSSLSAATVQFSAGSYEVWISAYSKTFDILKLTIDLPSVIRNPKDSPFQFENWFPSISADEGT